MTVKMLLVEDDASWRELVLSVVSDIGPTVSLQIAKSRDSAVAAVKEESFDLVILDLKIPTIDDALDANVEHGRLVFESLKAAASGTPVLILTGSPAESFISDFLSRSTKIDIWGDGEVATVNFLKKSDVDQLGEILAKYVSSIRSVFDIEVKAPEGLNFTWEQLRLIKIFVRRSSAVNCTIKRNGGGLSGSDVYRLSLTDERGVLVFHAILKVGTPEMVAKESTSYRTYINRLDEAATARAIGEICFGGGKLAAVAYRLAADYSVNIFDVVRTRPDQVVSVVGKIRSFVDPWINGIPEERRKVSEIRQRLVSDENYAKVVEKYELTWAPELENRYVQVKIGCCHGDFHGANILVNTTNDPIIIDYGDVDPGPACLDWICLELSVLFHVEGCARGSIWPSVEACKNWCDKETYAKDSDFKDFVLCCRGHAERSSAGAREIYATAYAYLLRQLVYEDTDKVRALALLDSVRRKIGET